MIPIQVLGTGLIPRGYGLAPRTKPFMADRLLIGTILATPGLIVNFVNPETGAATKITSKNMDRLISKWSGWTGKAKEAPAAKPAPKQSNFTGTTPDGRGVYKGQVVTGGVNTSTHAMNQTTAIQQEKKPETVNPPTPPAAQQETRAVETKPADPPKAESTEEKKDEASGEKKDEQKATPETPNTQKNNGFKPVSQNNNQNKNNQNNSDKK